MKNNQNSSYFHSGKNIDLKFIKQLTGREVPKMWADENGESKMIRPQVVKAICKLEEIESDKSGGGLGMFETKSNQLGVSAEIVDCDNRYCVAVYPDPSGEYKILVSKGDSGVYDFGFSKPEDGALMLTAWMFLLTITERPDSDIVILIEDTINEIRNLQTLPQGPIQDSLTKDFANLSEYFLQAFNDPNDHRLRLFNDQKNIEKLSKWAISSSKYAPQRVRWGKFEILSNLESNYKPKIQIVKQEMQEIKNDTESLPFQYTPEEIALIPKIPEWYIEPKELDTVCKLVLGSSSMTRRLRNFLFWGESSSGKSSLAKAIAGKLKMPYVYITCASDSESYTFFGQPMYDENGNIRYVKAPFIKGIGRRYVVEVQEPAVIVKQGILPGLNGVMDDGQTAILPTGEIITRHPDSIVIFTTNLDYAGCKKLNQSVRRRFNGIFPINKPSPQEVADRIAAITGINDAALLQGMVEVQDKIRIYLKDQELDEGVCGVSELLDWAEAYQCTHDLLGAAEYTISSKATDDLNAQDAIMGIIESKMQSISSLPLTGMSY